MFFITLYGIPLVVTRGYISSERLEPNQTLQSRKRGVGVREFQQVTQSWLVGSGCKWATEMDFWKLGGPFVLWSLWRLSFVFLEISDGRASCYKKTVWSISATWKECLEPLARESQGQWKIWQDERLTGQYCQTLAWNRFLSISSNVYKDRLSQWPSQISQSQPLS